MNAMSRMSVFLFFFPDHVLISSIVNGGTRPFFYMMEQFVSMGVRDHFSPYGGTHNEAPKRKKCCSVGLLECIFMAPLALFNEGVQDHFPILWLGWPSRMHIYCFVEIALYLCTIYL